MESIRDNLMEFVNKTPNAYYCVDNLRKVFLDNGFEELYENEEWNNLNADGKYFVVRNDSSIIAFKGCGKDNNVGFNIVSVHSDSPSFLIKPNADMFDGDYLKLNVSGYGGMINYSWLDRPLSLAGRVVTCTNGIYQSHLVNIDKDLLLIPSQAIHINRDVNSKNELNHQVDMLPVVTQFGDEKLEDIVRGNLEEQGICCDKICDYDLYLYNRDGAKVVGLNDDFILAPRLDDLGCVYPAAMGFIDSDNDNSVGVFCVFNNEEIGSLTKQGADSSFLIDVLTRYAKATDIDLLSSLQNSFVVSADNGHASHPNAKSKTDPTNSVLLNKGVVIKHHINYTTDAFSSSIFKGICDNAGVLYQDYACKSDMKCGSTLGGISQRHVSVDSIDIGLPQLGMHSANETIGTNDILYMYQSLLEFYNTTIQREKGKIRLLKK